MAGIPTIALLAGAGGFGLIALLPAIGHIKAAFHNWRLRQRLARDPYMLREEHRSYQHAIGDPAPLGPILLRAALVALVTGGAAWAWHSEIVAREVLEVMAGLIGLALAARAAWRLFNDPDELLVEGDPDNTPGAQRLQAGFDLGVAAMILASAAWSAGWL